MIEKIQIVSKDFKESFENMPLETVGRLTLAMFKYANDEDYSDILADDGIARAIFPTLKSHISRHEEYRVSMVENGRRGGAPKGNSNARKQPKTTENNRKQPKTTENKQKQTPNPIPNPNPNPIPIKKTYGECANVYLTDEEYSKINDDGLTGLIEELSLYIASKGDKYRSHYAVIRQWANRRKKEQDAKVIRPNQFTSGVQSRDIDFSDLEKKLVKN